MDESRSIVFGVSFSDKIKCIQQIQHVIMMNSKNLEKCDILKNSLKVYTNQNFKCLVFFEVG